MKKYLNVFFFISLAIAVFFFFYVNLSLDVIMLFLPLKIFFGFWLTKGVVPWFNPYIFAGVPFLFDIGLGNFHPFNVFFLLPYPFSYALWSGSTALVFLTGFFLFFRKFARTDRFAFLLTIILFLSGSGFFIRMGNPTMLLPVSHYGLFFYSLSFLGKKKNKLFPYIIGVSLILSGHIQYVFYGCILGFIICLVFYRQSLKTILRYFFVLGILTSWYFIMSLPLIFSSTRFYVDKVSTDTGPIKALQMIELAFPFFFGEVVSGSKWNAGFTNVVPVSLFFTVFLAFLIIGKKISKARLSVLALLLISALGLIKPPFFRGAGQVFILFHIVGLTIIAEREKEIGRLLTKNLSNGKARLVFLLIFLLLAAGIIFFSSGYFYDMFSSIYKIVKKNPPSLFFDRLTVLAIGRLIAKSLVFAMLIPAGILSAGFLKKRTVWVVIFAVVLIEGTLINTGYNYYVPAGRIVPKVSFGNMDLVNYRYQSALEVTPYVSFVNYVFNVYFQQPPFAKSKTFIDDREKKTLDLFDGYVSFILPSWTSVYRIKSVQGYNTFVPKRIADYFKNPSGDYMREYAEIIKQNPYFAQSEKGSSINTIELSRVTWSDRRWQELSVRYVKKNVNVLTEKKDARPIYAFVEADGGYRSLEPVYEDPNKTVFTVKKEDTGRRVDLNINPEGFLVKLDNQYLTYAKTAVGLSFVVGKPGRLEVYYSPVHHLAQLLEKYGIIKAHE